MMCLQQLTVLVWFSAAWSAELRVHRRAAPGACFRAGDISHEIFSTAEKTTDTKPLYFKVCIRPLYNVCLFCLWIFEVKTIILSFFNYASMCSYVFTERETQQILLAYIFWQYFHQNRALGCNISNEFLMKRTHQQKGWKSVNLAHPFSSPSVADGLESGVSQAEKPTPFAGAFEFTSPKSATQPVSEGGVQHRLSMRHVWQNNYALLQNSTLLTLCCLSCQAREGIQVIFRAAILLLLRVWACCSVRGLGARRCRPLTIFTGCWALGWAWPTKP